MIESLTPWANFRWADREEHPLTRRSEELFLLKMEGHPLAVKVMNSFYSLPIDGRKRSSGFIIDRLAQIVADMRRLSNTPRIPEELQVNE